MSFPSLPGLAGPGLANLPTLPSLPNFSLPGIPGLGGLGAASMPAPSSQKAERRIGFVLNDRTGALVRRVVMLSIRPEDLTRTDSSRVTVHQTLGGAFADSFGSGLPVINISGHTGWRRINGGTGEDGEERFRTLRDNVFTNWHALRQQATKAGKDPNLVTLDFVDQLDWMVSTVIPVSFVLRRSKSRPLLLQYQISMVVVDEADTRASAEATAAKNASVLSQLGLASMTASINMLINQTAAMKGFVQVAMLAPLTSFVSQTSALFSSITGMVSSGGLPSPTMLSIGQSLALGGANVFRTLANLPGQTQAHQCSLMLLAAAFSNILCVLINSIATQSYYADYTPLLGASNCSSTSGGSPLSPLADSNPFFTVVPVDIPGISMTVAAQAAMKALAASDVVLAPMSTGVLTTTIGALTAGMVVA